MITLVRKLFAALLSAIIFLSCVPITARATVGPLLGEQRVIVDGVPFMMWGVFEDATLSHFRLRDVAYILNGTPAQFNIREIDDDRFDYWIVRGEPYTPTGDEFRPISGYEEQGILWFDGGLFGHATVGVDGTDEPETAISLFARGDEDGFYFPVSDLALLLGFSLDWSRTGYFVHEFHDYYVENADYVISTGVSTPAVLSIKSIEFLELMMNLSGHWVDNVHFVSPVIDESVVWPVELHFSHDGQGISNFSWTTVAPIRRDSGGRAGLWYPLSMRYLEDGLVELAVIGPPVGEWNRVSPGYTFVDYLPQRIIVDTSGEYIDELIYYIEDVAHHMVRVAGRQRPRRYHIEPAEDGGIRIRYVLGRNPFGAFTSEFRIYRSQVQGEPGMPVFSQEDVGFVDPYDRMLFEFIDTTVERGNVYYYSLWTLAIWGHDEIKFADDTWQIRVDVDAILRNRLRRMWLSVLFPTMSRWLTI